jgi:hypothetical protein
MRWQDEYTQDVEKKRADWEAFAAAHGGTCVMKRTVDHVYNRLILTIPRKGFDLVLEESDKQNWHACAHGPSTHVEPFSVSPRSVVDTCLELLSPHGASFHSPILNQRLVLGGPGARKAQSLLETSTVLGQLESFGALNLVLLKDKDRFTLRFVPDPSHSFHASAAVAMAMLETLVEGLFAAEVLAL